MLEFPSQGNTGPHFIGYPITTSPIVRNVYFQHFTKQPAAAAAAAKSLQLCPTLCNPIDASPPSSPVPGIL